MSDRREQLEEWKRQKAARASLGGSALPKLDEPSQRKLSMSSQGRLSGGRSVTSEVGGITPVPAAAKPVQPSRSPKAVRRASVAPPSAIPRVATTAAPIAPPQLAARPAAKPKQSLEVLQAGLSSVQADLERTQRERDQLQSEIEALHESVAAGKEREAELQETIEKLSEEKRLIEVRMRAHMMWKHRLERARVLALSVRGGWSVARERCSGEQQT